jgi:U3 small nucleolar RNA-associated protein 11
VPSRRSARSSDFSKSTRLAIVLSSYLKCHPLTRAQQDYSLRAKDHKKKQTTLKSLRQKAADRNEDEFYFGMLSRSGPGGRLSKGKGWTGTVDGDRGNKSLDVETARLLKTQDMAYLRTVRTHLLKEVKELEERAVLAGAWAGEHGRVGADEEEGDEDGVQVKRPRKIVFVDPDQEDGNQPEEEDGDQRDSDAEPEPGDEDQPTQASTAADKAARLRRQLQAARRKLRALTTAEAELEMQRGRMAKTATSGGVTKSGRVIKVRTRKR